MGYAIAAVAIISFLGLAIQYSFFTLRTKVQVSNTPAMDWPSGESPMVHPRTAEQGDYPRKNATAIRAQHPNT